MTPKYFNKKIKDKKPLKGIFYKITIVQLNNETNLKNYKRYKFKDLGYLTLRWSEKTKDYNNYHGFITSVRLKTFLGRKEWVKFVRGKREFIIPNYIYKRLSSI